VIKIALRRPKATEFPLTRREVVLMPHGYLKKVVRSQL